MSIYVPSNTPGVTTLEDLVRAVRLRLGDFPQPQTQREPVDGVKTVFRLRDWVHEADGVDHDSFGSAASNTNTVDYDAGTITFTVSAPTLGSDSTANVTFTYSKVVWTDERITEALNAAIDELFGRFYAEGENATLTTDGEGELLAETAAGYDLGPEDRITKVEYWNGDRWVRLHSWSVRSTPEKKYLVWERIPDSGITLRVSYVVRPANLYDTLDTIEATSGLPTRAKEPLILFACSSLIVERMHHRIRDDRGHNTQSENPVKSYEIQNDAQFLRAQAELLAGRLRMTPLSSRVRY